MSCCQSCGMTSCAQHLSERGYISEAKATLHLSVGLGLQSVSEVMINPIATAFAGHLGKVELDAVSLANTLINVFCNAVVFGMVTACETYFSQAFGNNQIQLLGVLLQRAIIIFVLLFLVMCPLYINLEQLLLLLGQDPQVSKLAGDYIIVFLPGMFFFYISLVLKRYMACQNVVIPGVVIGVLSLAVLALFQYIFLYQLNLGIMGSSLAMNVSCLSMLLMLVAFIVITKRHKNMCQGFNWRMWANWGPFTKLGVYGILMMCLEWWAFEIAVLLAGILGTTELGAQGVFFNIDAIFISFAIGIGDASCIQVGQALGKGDPAQAKRAAKIGYVLTTLISSVICILIVVLRYELPKIFTNVPEVLELVSSMLPIMALYTFFDNISFVGRGVTRGAGMQGRVTLILVVAYYFIGLPVGIPLMFLTSAGLFGIWYGLGIAVFLATAIFLVYTLRILNWRSAANEAFDRVQDAEGSSHQEERNEDSCTETSGLIKSSLSNSGRRRASLSISQSMTQDGDEAMLDENLHSPVDIGSLIRRRLAAVVVVLAILTTGILCRIFLPAPELISYNNSTIIDITNSTEVHKLYT